MPKLISPWAYPQIIWYRQGCSKPYETRRTPLNRLEHILTSVIGSKHMSARCRFTRSLVVLNTCPRVKFPDAFEFQMQSSDSHIQVRQKRPGCRSQISIQLSRAQIGVLCSLRPHPIGRIFHLNSCSKPGHSDNCTTQYDAKARRPQSSFYT